MKKKILFMINSLDVGGAERILLNYIKNISLENKYDISVLTIKKSNSFIYDEINSIADIFSVDSYLENKILLKSIAKTFYIKKIINQNDVIIDFLDGDFYKYTKSCKTKKVVWLHYSYEALSLRKKNLKQKLSSYHHIVTICHTMTKELLDREPLLAGRVSHIYNPFLFDSIDHQSIDLSSFTSQEKDIIDSPYLLTVCRLDESQKDLSTLIKAYCHAKRNNTPLAPLVIVGDGPDAFFLKEMVADLQLQNDIHFIGMKSNPYVWMKNAQTFILSSKGEGLPTVLIEALYLGCNVISSNCKVGPSEILDNGRLGYLFEVGNVEELATLLGNIKKKTFDIEDEINIYRPETTINKFNKLIESI